MIGRRGFITGLVSLVAMPAVARIDDHPDYAYLDIIDKKINGRTFDLRGRRIVLMDRCEFKCCRFLFDENTAHVWMTHSTFNECDFDGFLKQSYLTFSHNVLVNCTGLPF